MNELQLSGDLNVISAEINSYKQIAGQSVFEIGKRLKHVKENDLAHGQFGAWLESIEFNQSTANKMMKAYEEFGNSESIPNLGTAKIFEFLSLPESIDRTEFIKQEHVIPSTGESKTVDEMTVKELREVKKALKDAERRANEAESNLNNTINQKNHFEALWKQAKDQPTKVITKVEKQLVTPDDYDELKQQAVLAQKLNNENVQLKRAANEIRSQYAEKLTEQNQRDSSRRSLQKYLSEQLRAISMNHDSAILNYRMIQGDREAHQIVMTFIEKYSEIIKHQMLEWEELTTIRAVK